MFPLLRVIPQWSHQMSSRLIKGWKGEKGKVGSGKVESPDELQEELIKKGGKGNVPWVESPGKLGERIWDSLPKCR
jgi:hypothetical protein